MHSILSRREFQLLLGLGFLGTARIARAAGGDRPQLDHIVFLVPDLEAGMDRFEAITGVRPLSGGIAPGRTASHNALVSLGGRSYLEVFSPDRAMTSGALNSTLPCAFSIFFRICATIFMSPLCTMHEPTKPRSTFLVPP